MPYKKDLKNWSKLKINIDSDKSRVFSFREKQIWWLAVGQNVGYEVYGKSEKFSRPVLIFKKFGSHTFLAIPVSTKEKEGIWYSSFVFQGNNQSALLSQLRMYDSKRLYNYIGELNSKDFEKIKSALKKLIF